LKFLGDRGDIYIEKVVAMGAIWRKPESTFLVPEKVAMLMFGIVSDGGYVEKRPTDG
jgi:hypothetical protein